MEVIKQQVDNVVAAVAIRMSAETKNTAFVPFSKSAAVTHQNDKRPTRLLTTDIMQTYHKVNDWYTRVKNIPLPHELHHGNNRYVIKSKLGKGSFSTVYVAKMNGERHVAVKVMHNSHSYYHGTKNESVAARLFMDMDADEVNSNCILQPLDQFRHLFRRILVFPLCAGDANKYNKQLRDCMHIVAHQLLTAVSFIHKHGIIHCDIKPENILVNPTGLKLSDFGSCSFGPLQGPVYAVSRYYRPPEVVFGDSVTAASDMWSVGCVLYEIAVGDPLFPAFSNSELLALMCDELGFPTTLRDEMENRHLFSDDGTILAYLKKRPGKHTTKHRLYADETGNRNALSKLDAPLQELVRKMLVWDPAARISAADALDYINTVQFKHAT